MPNYIVLRLVPPAAVDAGTFAGYLNNLQINVYDISYAHASGGTLIGSASAAASQIVQHAPPPLFVPQSVATAVILYPAGGPEYGGPDLRVEFVRTGEPTVTDTQFYYDVTVFNIPQPPPFPDPSTIQAILDANVSAFVTLNLQDDLITLQNDGSPPNFDTLRAAVSAVLAQDPAQPVTPTLLGI